MDGLYCFRYYNAVRRHFTTARFDIQKYGFKSKSVSTKVYEEDRCRPIYERLAEVYQKDEFHILCITNIFLDPSVWIDQLLTQEAYEHYLWQKKYLLRPDYFLIEEFRYLHNKYDKIAKFDIWQEIVNMKIHADSVIHLCRMFPAFEEKLKRESTHIVRQSIYNRLQKYKTFVVAPEVSYYQNVREKMFDLCLERA